MRFTVRSIKYRDWKESLHYGVKSFCFKSSLYLKSSSKMQLFKYFIKPSCKNAQSISLKAILKVISEGFYFLLTSWSFQFAFPQALVPGLCLLRPGGQDPVVGGSRALPLRPWCQLCTVFRVVWLDICSWSSVSFPWATG